MVYFLQMGQKGNIKIGYSENIIKRMKSLQTGSPEKLLLLGFVTGDKEKEKELHKKFRQYKLKGEWFQPSQEIIDYINSVNEESVYIHIDEEGKSWVLKKIKK